MTKDAYNTVFGESESVTVIEKSKFICNLKNISDENDAKEYIEIIRKRHPFATHGCFAYIADENGMTQKFSDDGEPQGTAGLPMLEVLKNKKIYKTVAVVTRYFGGIKLGTGGLVRAYGGAVENALSLAKIVCMSMAVHYSCALDYEFYDKFSAFCKNADVVVADKVFSDKIELKIVVRESEKVLFTDRLNDCFNGKITIYETSKAYYPFETKNA